MASWQNLLIKGYFRFRRFQRRSVQPDIEQRRASLEALASRGKLPPDLQREAASVDGIPAEWVYFSDSIADHVILYLHGGGYLLGSLDSHRALAGAIAKAAKARAFVVDYRLAPENPFPAAVEDATAAYRWLLTAGFNPGKIVFAGDSAGGGLALAALVALRDDGEPLPAAAVCLSPWTDLAGTGESISSKAKADPWLEPAGLLQSAQLYLRDNDPRNPLASPLYADLSGLPPIFIQVGSSEILLSDAVRFAERAEAAGVEVTLEVWQGMIHVFQAFAKFLPEGRQAIEAVGQYVQTKLG